MEEQGTIERARQFALEAHGDQKYGDEPYSVHLDAVAAILQAQGQSEACIAVGYLHDTIEDTSITESELAQAFSEEIAAAVVFCSDEAGQNRKERKAATYARMAVDIANNPNWLTLGVMAKAADRLANAHASSVSNPRLFEMYQGEHEQFRATLYVAGMCDGLWTQLDSLLG